MQHRNNTNRANNRNHKQQLSPLGYGIAGIAAIILLALFGRLLLILAVIGGIGWLVWKCRWAIRYFAEEFRVSLNRQDQVFRQKYQRIHQQCDDNPDVNPFQRSTAFQPVNVDRDGFSGRRNTIIDVTPGKGRK